MYKRILVGLDGSKNALKAVKAAVEVALRFDSEVHLLTVTRPFKVSPQLRRYLEVENLMGEPKYVLDQMTEEIVDTAREIAEKAKVKKVKTAVREGKPARALVDYARNNRVDLIVLGSRGVGEIEAALLGSVSNKVSHLAHCTCMIVR